MSNSALYIYSSRILANYENLNSERKKATFARNFSDVKYLISIIYFFPDFSYLTRLKSY